MQDDSVERAVRNGELLAVHDGQVHAVARPRLLPEGHRALQPIVGRDPVLGVGEVVPSGGGARAGYRVMTAATPGEAISLCEKHPAGSISS